jgi:hypothetical protein
MKIEIGNSEVTLEPQDIARITNTYLDHSTPDHCDIECLWKGVRATVVFRQTCGVWSLELSAFREGYLKLVDSATMEPNVVSAWIDSLKDD